MEQQHQECHDPETSRGIQKWKINGTIIHQIQETPLKHCRFLQEKSASHTLEPQHVCVCFCVCWCCAYLSHNFCFQQSHKSLGFANPTCDMCITGLFSCHFLVLAVAQYQRWLNYSTSLTADNFGRIPGILNIISATSQGSFLVIHPDLLLIEHHGDTYSYIFLLCH